MRIIRSNNTLRICSLNIHILGTGIFVALWELAEVLEEWMLFRVSRNLELPEGLKR